MLYFSNRDQKANLGTANLGTGPTPSPAYGKSVSCFCSRHHSIHGAAPCQTAIVGRVIDSLIETRVLQALQPASLELSFQVVEDETKRRETTELQYVHALQRANYDADRARRRYEAVDPANRLVAATVEQ